MRPGSIFGSVLLFLAATASARQSLSFFGSSQHPLQDEEPLPVPGDNPLMFCEKPDDYILSLDQVDLAPNPPEAGNALSIVAKGKLAEKVEKGAKVHLQVKYGMLRLLNQEVELCDYASEVSLECPLEGDLTIKKDVDLPAEIPPGTYTVLADVYTKDEKKITCLTASVAFGSG